MITFTRLRAQNSGCFRELDVPLNKQGNVLVIGENRDEPKTSDGRRHSNGSGKSTIFELLTHGLFQTCSKPEFRKNGIINLFHPKDCFIEVEFTIGVHEYTVRQYRKHTVHGTSLKLFKDGTEISAQGTRAIPETQVLLESILGLTLGEWYGFVYLAQRHVHSMVEGKPSEKRQYLSRVFSLDVIDDYDENLKSFLSGLSDKVDQLKALEARKRELRLELKDLQAEQYPADLDERVAKASKELRKAQDAVANAKVSFKRIDISARLVKAGVVKSTDPTGPGFDILLSGLYSTARKAHAAAVDARRQAERRKEVKSKIQTDLPPEDDVRSKLKIYGERLSALRDSSKIQAKVASLDARLKGFTVQGDATTVAQIVAKQKKLIDKSTELHGRLVVVKEELKKLKALDGHSECPTCLQTLKADRVAELVEEREKLRDDYEAPCREAHKKAQELGTKINDLEAYIRVVNEKAETVKDLPKGVLDLDNARADIKRIDAKIVALQDTLVDLKAQAAYEAELSKLPKPAHVPTDAELDKLQLELDLLSEARAHDWKVPLVDLPAAREARESAQHAVDKLLKKQAARDQFEVTRAKVEKELADVRKQITALESTADHHHVASTMRLALKDLKTTRLQEATRVLTDILPGYVSALFPGKNVKIRIDDRKADSFDLLFEKGGKIIPLGSLSGGQSKKLGIAAVLAFTQLTNSRVNILIADEPYSALDRPSRQIGDELIREAGVSSTFLMSHDVDLLARRYDRVWRCIMKGDVSTLKRSRL